MADAGPRQRPESEGEKSPGTVPRRGVVVNPEAIEPGLAARVFRSAPIGLAVITAPGTITWASRGYFDLTGRLPTILGTDFHDLSEEDGSWSTEIRVAMDRVLRDGTPATFRSVRARFRAPSPGIYFDLDVRPLEPEDGAPRRALLLIRDVSDREREHAQAVLFYESFRTSTNAMQLTDARGVMIDVNPSFERIYGYTRAECIGKKPNLVRSRHTPPEVYEGLWADLIDPARGYWSGEILNRDRKGRERPVLLSVTAIRDGSGATTHYLGVAVDLSEQRSWELRAAHADKLASVGQLAAGVAHEINTPLANVMLVAESLRRRSDDPWVLARLSTMTDQIEIAARIVRGLLDFARREEPLTTELDLVEIARESVAFLKGKQSANVEIAEKHPGTPIPILGDRGQLMQVLTNILNNAYDAMEGVGAIDISVRTQGRRAEVEILDHGPGISPEALPQIFEPFFTTKPEGQGTGLGLAICHGIVHSHHGTITVRNVPGAGAAFLVSLPLHPPTERPPTSSPSAASKR